MPLPKHHYSPKFYLKQWASPIDGRLIEFTQRRQGDFIRVVARDTHPGGTGYVRGLNLMLGYPPKLQDQFETVVMQSVDNRAYDALLKLNSDDNTPWQAKPRSSWTRFILSLMFRNPEALAKVGRQLSVLPALQTEEPRATYARLSGPNAPDFDTYMREDLGGARFQFALAMMNQPRIGGLINNMT